MRTSPPARWMLAGLLGLSLAALAEPLPFQMRLPQGAKAAWLLHQAKPLPRLSRFEVDSQDNVWVLMGPRILFGSNGGTLVLEAPIHDVAFGGAQLYASTDSVAGPLSLHRHKNFMLAKVKSQLLLPDPSWRLAAGPASAAVIGFDAESGKGQLFRVEDQRKVLEWPARILAAVGTADAWFLSTPAGIQRISSSGERKFWGLLPGGASSLAWVQGAGLVAAGPRGVALFRSPGKLLGLSDAADARVRARGAKLFVLLPEEGGVMQITGLGGQ